MSEKVTVLAAALVQEGESIFLSRHGAQGKWHLPDVEVRFGETVAEALDRGFREDFGIGLDVDGKVIATAQVVDAEKGTHYVILCCRATLQNYAHLSGHRNAAPEICIAKI